MYHIWSYLFKHIRCDEHDIRVRWHLTLNGAGLATIGIENNYGEELSLVNDIGITNVVGTGATGLLITTASNGDANNSGPYSNIYCSNTTTCAQIEGTTGTRGIHGLTATMSGGATAVSVDAPNNTIEDVYVSGYTDGVYIGQNAYAANNELVNILAGTGVTNLVHISAHTSTASVCPVVSGSFPNACDITIFAASNASNAVIQDDLNQTTVSASVGPSVAMYALGEQIAAGTSTQPPYSRMTTAGATSGATSNPVNWSFGASSPTGGTSCGIGSLYSCTKQSGGSCTSTIATTTTLWGCTTSGWTPITLF